MAAKKKTNIQIENFPIVKRTINLLKNEGILSGDDFANYTKKNLQEIKGLGAAGLSELLFFLKGAGIKLKKAEKVEKKAPKWDPKTREILLRVQKGIINNYAQEQQMMGKLIDKFGVETMERVSVPATCQPPTVRYFFSGGQIAGWAHDYIQKFAPIRIIEREKPVIPPPPDLEGDGGVEEIIGFKAPIEPRVPKTLGEFLASRK